ncbi:M67 family metallopeptidase [Erythrobacter sp. SDW2]|uniref:Mov34/MPN/PAD-1 family protein n=1 Tax=Erythrobacter sp. SDW2 TaxID=2907154 RepID=UPI001F3C9DE1|nr:M67 family metallopeptidase [Erythrobacter sp. SDW2]UIP06597.1 M67 family metallopeptidase [Erythrobacter sp. SDW2]
MIREVSSAVVAGILGHAADAHPRECCGILLGKDGRITAFLPADNVHPQPENHFEIDPQALIDAHRAARHGGPRVAGYYHSHPNGHAEPSPTDRRQAAHDGSIWAIVAAGTVTIWRDAPEGFVPLSYRVSAS